MGLYLGTWNKATTKSRASGSAPPPVVSTSFPLSFDAFALVSCASVSFDTFVGFPLPRRRSIHWRGGSPPPVVVAGFPQPPCLSTRWPGEAAPHPQSSSLGSLSLHVFCHVGLGSLRLGVVRHVGDAASQPQSSSLGSLSLRVF